MKIESNKIINNLFLIIVIILLSLITIYLRDLSKIGRFQTTGDGSSILDTKNGQTYSINPKNYNIDSTFWKRIQETEPIIKE